MTPPGTAVPRTTPADDVDTSLGRRLYAVMIVVVVVGFVATRTALLVTSYDANRNWEEPVFLFSASELARDGVTHVFDYQDDLNHGGSVVVLLLAVEPLCIGVVRERFGA